MESLQTSSSTGTADLPASDRTPRNNGGVKETIESILVAFILAFVFRAFVVEAFVIPTGSMATTLLGAHTRFHCPDCGYNFDVNFSERQGNSENEEVIDDRAGVINSPIYCPNCGCPMPQEQLNKPPVFYGDRILVLKYLYLLEPPSRWDVVVFKAPPEQESNYSVNYIKRLIGKPGESIMILDGDVYIRPPNDSNPDHFVVQPKPKPVQDAMWRLAYNNDYHPQGKNELHPRGIIDRGNALPWKQPWTAVSGTGWKLDDPATNGRVFRFASPSGSSKLHFDPTANPTAQTLSDYLVYDQQPDTMPIARRDVTSQYPLTATVTRTETEMPVSDVDLRLTYQRDSGTGPLQLQLMKRDHHFTAEITPTQVVVYQDFKGKHAQIGSAYALPASLDPIRVEFSLADYQIRLYINDHLAVQSTPADFSPDIPALIGEFENHRTPPPGSVDIIASAQQCGLSHISLWRDQFYYNDRMGVMRAYPGNPQVLGKDEYFVMGDNSLLSSDAHCWKNGVDLPAEGIDIGAGKVPGRFLLGKAFFVYWPAGYQPFSSGPALVPNFGSMRFIH